MFWQNFHHHAILQSFHWLFENSITLLFHCRAILLLKESVPDYKGSACLLWRRHIHRSFHFPSHDYFKLNDIKRSPLYRNLQPLEEESGYLTTKLTGEAVAFIERNKDKPFFAYVAFNAVHFPAQAPKKDIEKFNTGDSTRNILMAMLEHLDTGVGEIIKALKKNKLYENTIVIYLSDNGGAPNMHARNEPLRGHKHLNYEGGVRVPFIMSWPAMIKPSQEVSTPVISLDLLPTICAAAGVTIKKSNKPVDGMNILPLAFGKSNKLHDYLCWNGGDGQWAIRKDNWKIYGKNDELELYNLKDDLSEKINLIKQNTSKAKELKEIYDNWLAQMPAHKNVKGGRSAED